MCYCCFRQHWRLFVNSTWAAAQEVFSGFPQSSPLWAKPVLWKVSAGPDFQIKPSVTEGGDAKTKHNLVHLIQAAIAAVSLSGFVRFLSGGSTACLDHLVFTAAVWLREEFLSLFFPSFLGTQKILADAL